MIDREKVIIELEQCLDDSIAAVVPADTVRAALALLKAQEPRVISLQDAESMRLCWIETKYTHTIRPSDLMHYFDESPCVTVFSIHQTPMDWPIDEYGVKWRCWNKEPTIEQMEAIPWE